MPKKIENNSYTNAEKEFMNVFKALCCEHDAWQVWNDFVTATACAISNSVDMNETRREKREEEFEKCSEKLGGVDNGAKLYAIFVNALEEKSEQDFLGTLFMKLNLTNHWRGQFFTPYCVCKTMSAINSTFLEDEIENKGWVSVNDPACGAGATLIAMANTLREHDINYQNHVLFTGQDISRIAGLMCYIQISLLGCAGYVVIADTLCNPISGINAMFPIEKDGQEIWYTPMYFSSIWDGRRRCNMIDMFLTKFSDM